MRGVGALLVVALLGGCASPSAAPGDDASAWPWVACAHPWPCGDGTEWPLGLGTPPDGFALREHVSVRVPMDDGVVLDGAVWLPELPAGARAPVVLWATPYAGQCRYSQFVGVPSGAGDAVPGCDEDPRVADDFYEGVFAFLVREGYAAAMLSMRGTGLSGGCFDLYGPRGQADMAQAVEWFGAQAWSNGRVGMWGVSAMGTTPFMAAIGAPPSLKAIAPSGIITDLYLNRFTPQGAPDLTGGSFQAGWSAFNSVVPPGGVVTDRFVQDVPEGIVAMAQNAPTRWCDDVATTLAAGATSQHADERDEGFWKERRLVDRFGDIRAAVFVMQGFQDYGHAWQDDVAWSPIGAPKQMLLGQWGHEVFFDDALGDHPGGNSTRRLLVEWFDFWLKGRGEPPRLGIVEHQDSAGVWRQSDAWPPATPMELVYLGDGALSDAPGAGSTFRASAASHPPPCGYGTDPPGEASLVLESAPLASDVAIVGNPMAFLELTASEPGGAFALTLYEVDAEGACVALVSEGGVDLRFHAGNMVGEDFPVGVATGVRVDLLGAAHVVRAGHALRAVFSSGESGTVGQPQYAPEIHVGGASHLVVPLAEGTLGGEAPTREYPPRPFAPTRPS